jgi:DNA-binding transcriptional ArsR family regulator
MPGRESVPSVPGESEIRLPDSEAIPVRVRISPLASVLANVLEVVAERPYGSPASWRRLMAGHLREVDLSPFDVLRTPTGCFADFVLPSPTAPRASFDDEIRLFRGTSPARVREDVSAEFGDDVPAAYQVYLDRPHSALERLSDALAAVWRTTYAPLWPVMESILEREQLTLGAALAAEGPSALLARVHPRIEFRDGMLKWVHRTQVRTDLGSRLLVLVPLVAGPDAVISNPGHRDGALLAYAAPGAAALWEAGEGARVGAEALGELLGATRARVMLAVQTPATTGDVALQLDVSSQLVSHHLIALRRQGLVDANRFGRRVYYRLSGRGRNLRDALSD